MSFDGLQKSDRKTASGRIAGTILLGLYRMRKRSTTAIAGSSEKRAARLHAE
jgi:hypothetical protein